MSEPASVGCDPAVEQRWARIQSKLAAHSLDLITQGAVVTKQAGKRRVAVVRFVVQEEGGRRTQKSIYVGDDAELISRTRALLASYHERASWPRQVAEMARLSASLGWRLGQLPGGVRVNRLRVGRPLRLAPPPAVQPPGT